MTSLDFLYIALGGGFVILVIFICALVLNLTIVLRDVTKITNNVKEISDRIRESVLDPLKALSEMTAGFGFLHDFFERIRAKFEEAADEDQDQEEVEKKVDKNKSKGKGGFSIKKLSE